MIRRKIDLTLAVPTFNSAGYLPDIFNALRNMTVVPQSILFTDNCSTDGTFALIEDFKRDNSDLYVRAFVNDGNLGVAGNYNRIIERCLDTTWVQILDSDDCLLSDYYAAIEPRLEHATDLLITSMRSSSEALNAYVAAFETLARALRLRSVPRTVQPLGSISTRSALIYRTSVLKSRPFTDPFFDGSDIIHAQQFLSRNEYCPEARVFYRLHQSSQTSAIDRHRRRRRDDRARYLTFIDQLSPARRLAYNVDFFLRKKIGGLIRRG